MMKAGPQRQLHVPAAVRLPFHRRGLRVPVIEIADQTDTAGRGDGANKIDRLDSPDGGQTHWWAEAKGRNGHVLQSFFH
jgi:hypothetical protein